MIILHQTLVWIFEQPYLQSSPWIPSISVGLNPNTSFNHHPLQSSWPKPNFKYYLLNPPPPGRDSKTEKPSNLIRQWNNFLSINWLRNQKNLINAYRKQFLKSCSFNFFSNVLVGRFCDKKKDRENYGCQKMNLFEKKWKELDFKNCLW